jgi:hypothetical protein
MKLKGFCRKKEMVTRSESVHEWEKIFSSSRYGKRFIIRIYREIKNVNSKSNDPMKKWGNELNRAFSK